MSNSPPGLEYSGTRTRSFSTWASELAAKPNNRTAILLFLGRLDMLATPLPPPVFHKNCTALVTQCARSESLLCPSYASLSCNSTLALVGAALQLFGVFYPGLILFSYFRVVLRFLEGAQLLIGQSHYAAVFVPVRSHTNDVFLLNERLQIPISTAGTEGHVPSV